MLYLNEIAVYIKEKYALEVSLSTISHLLKVKSISKKVVSLRSYLDLYLYTVHENVNRQGIFCW